MLSYCLKCREKTDSKTPRVAKTNKGRLMKSLKCVVCDSKNSRFFKEQEPIGLKAPLGKIPLKI